jgi:hypothetical protein
VRGRAKTAIPNLITDKDVRFSAKISWASRNRTDDSSEASLSKSHITSHNNQFNPNSPINVDQLFYTIPVFRQIKKPLMIFAIRQG